MRTIYKYALKVTDTQEIRMPAGAEFLTAQMQHGRLCVWAIVDPSRKDELEYFIICGTGHPLPDKPRFLQYLATVQDAGGSLIWHVFRAIK